MKGLFWRFAISLVLVLGGSWLVTAQTSGTISGVVTDERQGVLPNLRVMVRNVDQNTVRSVATDSEGRYRFQNLPTGNYELKVEAAGFARYIHSGIELLLNQNAVIDVSMKPATVNEVVNVTENASLLNTSNAEVGVRFDSKRISELPLATNRNVYNIALSAAGVSQLGSGQQTFAGGGAESTSGVSFSANGGRVRSNNFMIDGQDNNDFGVAGATVPLNNPDLIQEIRLVTNQFSAEYGRNGSAVFNAVTKSGSNNYHGSAFWFHNDNALNALSNTNKGAGLKNAPFRVENQIGGTFGGPLHLPRFGQGGPALINGKDRTFFFFSLQRWSDRQLATGTTLNGAPTEAGRQVLQSVVGDRPQVAALLRFLPAAQTPCSPACTPAQFNLNGVTYSVPLGSLGGSQPSTFDDWQWSFRLDHRLTANNSLSGRYIFQDSTTAGINSQITPPGFSSLAGQRTQGVNLSLTSVLGSRLVNEARAAFLRSNSSNIALDPQSEEIPSIELTELGLTGFNAATNRTAIGLGINLPQSAARNTYQVQDTLSYTTGAHSFKFGADLHRSQLHQLFKPSVRGRLVYTNLNRFVSDVANTAVINQDLPGVARILHLDWYDAFFFAQDEWKVKPNFALTFGLRYELPGQPIQDLVALNEPVLAAAGNDPRYKLSPVPGLDKNNFQPRFGFNWNLRTRGTGLRGALFGKDRTVLRGGYSRTNDYAFTNIALNIWSSFPFVAAVNVRIAPQGVVTPILVGGEPRPADRNDGVVNAWATLQNPPLDLSSLVRTVVSDDFHSPVYDSASLEIQRELAPNYILRVGYVGTRGTGLFQTIDGNPTVPFVRDRRVNPSIGPVRLRANAASSTYHSLQVSLDKRLSRNFSAGVHYTYSSFIDTASEIFNPSGAEVAVAQDSYNLRADRARSSYDRPHRFSGNVVYEFPFHRAQKGLIGHLLGGWQVNAFFTLQSGAPFTVLNGSDPTGALDGISGLVGDAIRPNLNTDLNLSSMSIPEILAAGGKALFRTLGSSERVGNAGRNILRADGINNIDLGFLKGVRIKEGQVLQFRADLYNATNTRNFGIPEGRVTSSSFLNQWGTNGGNRRIILGLRYTF
ncbi:MAG TPA: carboxypeptidase regulatory-like domain-containing protein [Blastocatellia bacterium]|nr:carboxypeptidase regulatory-like domain-containing protein [Blastocatellia bacterium]